MDTNKQVIEIGGVKLEVDMRYAKRVDTLHVGDPVRVMTKGYGESYTVHSGMVVGFEPFAKLPTIIVAYLQGGYDTAEVKFIHMNENTKDVEIVAADRDALVAFDEKECLKGLDRTIEKARRALVDPPDKTSYFVHHIGRAWAPVEKAVAA